MDNTEDRGFKWDSRFPTLRKWRIANFKSIKNATEIVLAPLTVVVGANSSGKSTLIQSILLMAQNAMRSTEFSSAKAQGKFELNSSLIQLGTFKEALCDLGESKNKKNEFNLGGLWAIGANRLVVTRRMSPIGSKHSRVDGEFFLDWDADFFAIDRDFNSGVVQVKDAEARSLRSDSEIQSELVKYRRSSAELKLVKEKYNRFSFDHTSSLKFDDEQAKPQVSKYSAESTLKSGKVRKSGAVSFRSGLPISGLIEKNIVEYILENQIRLYQMESRLSQEGGRVLDAEAEGEIRKMFPSGGDSIKSGVSKKALIEKNVPYDSEAALIDDYVKQLALVARQLLQRERIADDDSPSLSFLVEQEHIIPFKQFPSSNDSSFFSDSIISRHEGYRIKTGMKSLSESISDQYWDSFFYLVRTKFYEIHGKSEWVHESIYCSPDGKRSLNPLHGTSITSRLVEFWNRFLAESLVYLGPLRVGPRAAYGIGPATENENIPLGESGEFLAKKLFNERAINSYPILENGELRKGRISLEEAVSFWYDFLVDTREPNAISVGAPSRQGYPLNIANRTLADVGFGASQILPVLGLCLSARPGTLILLEQPELHLNPGMQQKLADFLLYMSKTGRQIIVETHSEYLITRLRRNAASNVDDHKYFSIIFVERDSKTGSSYRTVSVDDQGDLSEWPKGFFDHVADDLRVLMRRAAERQSGKLEK